MADKYQYYSCLVPEALRPGQGDSEEDDPPSPPPRPPKNLTAQSSTHTPVRDYQQGQGRGYRPHDHSPTRRATAGSPTSYRGQDSSPTRRVVAGSPSYSQDGDRSCYFSDESPPPMPPRMSAWQYDGDKVPQTLTQNMSPATSPKWAKPVQTVYPDPSVGKGQFSPGPVSPNSVYNFNQTTYSDPSPSVSQLSPGLPEKSPRRHTIDSQFPMPLVLPNDQSPALPQRSPVSKQYSEGGSCESSPIPPQRSPKKNNSDRVSYEYPLSSPRHHEYHQVIYRIDI